MNHIVMNGYHGIMAFILLRKKKTFLDVSSQASHLTRSTRRLYGKLKYAKWHPRTSCWKIFLYLEINTEENHQKYLRVVKLYTLHIGYQHIHGGEEMGLISSWPL